MQLPKILLDSPDDIEVARLRYLRSLLDGWAKKPEASTGFTARFVFDFDGTNHWEGVILVLESKDDRCILRRADSADGTEKATFTRWKGPQDPIPTRGLQAPLPHFRDLTPEILLDAIHLLMVDETMEQ